MNNDFIIKIIDDLTYYPESYLNDHNNILFGSKTADKYIKFKNIFFIFSYFITRSILIAFGIIIIHVIFDNVLYKYIKILSLRTLIEMFTVFIYLFFQIKAIVKYFK